jgi:Protein of unknown function (DUF2971)
MKNVPAGGTDMNGRPEYFYKFTTIDRAVEILTKCKLFFPSPADFNDPFDCQFLTTFTASRLKRERVVRELARERNPGTPKPLIKKLAKRASSRAFFEESARRLKARIGRSVGILCVTERNDSVQMWSHYANKHQGVCLKFHGLENLSTPPLRVSYSDDYPTVALLDYEPFLNGQDATARAKQKEMVERMYLTKAKGWSYEREWRIVDWAAARSGSRGFHSLAPDVLIGVILGCRTTDPDKQTIMGCISQSEARPKLYQATQSTISFTLDISEAE